MVDQAMAKKGDQSLSKSTGRSGFGVMALGCMTLLFLWVNVLVAIFLLPRWVEIYEDFDAELPWLTEMFLSTRVFQWLGLGAVVSLIVVFLMVIGRRGRGAFFIGALLFVVNVILILVLSLVVVQPLSTLLQTMDQ